MIEFEKTIRGFVVTIYAGEFYDGGTEDIYAKTQDGQYFELTEQEIEELSSEATDIYYCGLDY